MYLLLTQPYILGEFVTRSCNNIFYPESFGVVFVMDLPFCFQGFPFCFGEV